MKQRYFQTQCGALAFLTTKLLRHGTSRQIRRPAQCLVEFFFCRGGVERSTPLERFVDRELFPPLHIGPKRHSKPESLRETRLLSQPQYRLTRLPPMRRQVRQDVRRQPRETQPRATQTSAIIPIPPEPVKRDGVAN